MLQSFFKGIRQKVLWFMQPVSHWIEQVWSICSLLWFISIKDQIRTLSPEPIYHQMASWREIHWTRNIRNAKFDWIKDYSSRLIVINRSSLSFLHSKCTMENLWRSLQINPRFFDEHSRVEICETLTYDHVCIFSLYWTQELK
jgi:hypothetical protein